MPKLIHEKELTALAKRFRKKAGIKRAQAARDMQVSQTSIFQAEEMPELALRKLRVRMIDAYSPYKVEGAVYYLKRK